MGGDDFERERQEYFEKSKGVAEGPDGHFWRWSSYARGDIPAWHPAMLRRKRGKRRKRRPAGWRDFVGPALFLLGLLSFIALVSILADLR